MESKIVLPSSQNKCAMYKRLPIVVKAFQWHGWTANYDPFNVMQPMMFLSMLTAIYVTYNKFARNKYNEDPRELATVKDASGLAHPGCWILQHGDNQYEILTNKQFLAQYQECEFVSKEHADWMNPGKSEQDYDSEDPKYEEAKMSREEGLIKSSEYQCPVCNNRVNPETADWRFEDGVWQHYHGYQTGWIIAKKRM